MSGGRRIAPRQLLPAIRIAALTAAFLLALHGFAHAYAALRGHPGSLGNNILHAFRLVTGQFPEELDDRPLPWTLDVARWAVPLLTVWTTAGLLWIRLRNPVRVRWLRRRGEHLVLAGGPLLTPVLARANAHAQRPTLLWVDDAAAPWVSAAADLGVPHVSGGDDSGGVAALGLRRAHAALIVHDDDTRNLGLAGIVAAEAARVRPAGDPLAVLARVDDLDLRAAADARLAGLGDHRTARLRLVSLPDLLARRLFVDTPLDGFVRVGGTERLVLALGFSPLVESYALRLLAGGHHRDGTRPRLIVHAPDAEACERAFRARRPGADALAPILFERAATDQPASIGALLAAAVARHGAPVALLIDPGNEARALALAFAAERWFRDEGLPAPPIHARIGPCPDAQLGSMIRRLSGADCLADPEALLDEEHDALARSIHDVYLEGRLAAGQSIGAHSAIAEWDDLPESVRDDNRLVADCYRLKLRDIGARLASGGGATFRLDSDEIEALSRAEHDRWMAAKLAGGWRHGASRDDRRRVHPDIVGYDMLSEPVKELDREQIKLMTRLLPRAGSTPRRLLSVLVTASRDGATLETALRGLRERHPDRVIALIGRFEDADHRALLDGVPDILVQFALAHNIDALIERCTQAERARALRLARATDTFWAFLPGTPDAESDAWLAGHADLRIEVAVAR